MRTRPLTLVESVDLLGRYRYVELASFAAIGRRSLACEDPAIMVFLDSAARAHGFRAQLIEQRLPVTVGLPGTEASTRQPHPGVDAALALACAPGPDVEVVAALVDALYPAMADAYRARVAVASFAADPPVLLALRRVVADLEGVIGTGAALRGKDRSSGRSVEVARLLEEGGGPFGPLRADI